MVFSLIKNKKDFNDLIIPAPKYRSVEPHPDIDWIREEYKKYATKFELHIESMDESVVETCYWFSSCKSKSRLLNITKLIDSIGYFDVVFNDIIRSQSESKMKIFFENLSKALIERKPDPDFSLGMKFYESTEITYTDMEPSQKIRLENCFKKFVENQKLMNFGYGFKGTVVPLEQYYDIRYHEGAFSLLSIFREYALEISLNTVLDNEDVKQFMIWYNIWYITSSDPFELKRKLVFNDVSNGMITYAFHNKCSLQEAIDYNNQLINKSFEKMQALREKILSNTSLITTELKEYLENIEDLNNAFVKFYYRSYCCKEINGVLFSEKWNILSDELPD